MTLLAVDDITVRYGRLTALRGVTLSISEGEVLFVTGPNGAGKSTLLNAIAGVVPHVSGAITLNGADLTGVPPESIARRGFSLVPEGRHVFGALTVEENLKVGAGMRAVASDGTSWSSAVHFTVAPAASPVAHSGGDRPSAY